MSALRTGRLNPSGDIPDTHFCQRLSRDQGHSATGTIMSMKNSSNTIRFRTRDLPACSAVPQPTAPPAACVVVYKGFEEILFPKHAPVGGTDDVSRLRAGHPKRRGPFPANYKKSILSLGVMTGVGTLPPSYSMGTVSCSYGDRVAEAFI